MVMIMKEYVINKKVYKVKRVSVDDSITTVLDRIINLLIQMKEASSNEGEKNVSTKN